MALVIPRKTTNSQRVSGLSLDILSNIKSKNELIADVIGLLQSPAKNVISALQSGANILHGVLETLSNKE